MDRVVIDPGVLISALLSPQGPPARLLLAWRAGSFELIVFSGLLAELEEVLLRPKFGHYVSAEEVHMYLEILRREALVEPDPRSVEPGLTPDPDDDNLVALAREAKAHFLVAGDPHLTALPDPDPPVLTPRAFLERLG
ncbi:MAG: putative toxin-antitoxin system toxin component, PIN family [Actinomycetota bacterium]